MAPFGVIAKMVRTSNTAIKFSRQTYDHEKSIRDNELWGFWWASRFRCRTGVTARWKGKWTICGHRRRHGFYAFHSYEPSLKRFWASLCFIRTLQSRFSRTTRTVFLKSAPVPVYRTWTPAVTARKPMEVRILRFSNTLSLANTRIHHLRDLVEIIHV